MRNKFIYIFISLICAVFFVLFVTGIFKKKSKASVTTEKLTFKRNYRSVAIGDSMFFLSPISFGKLIAYSDSNVVLLNSDFLSISKLDNKFKLIEKLQLDSIFADAKLDHIDGVQIFPNQVVIFCGNSTSVLFSSALSKNSFSKKVSLGYSYSTAVALDENEIILKSLDKEKNSIFKRFYVNDIQNTDSNYILPKDKSAGMKTSGMLIANNEKLYHINYYNSDIYCFDRNLKLLHKYNTVDHSEKLPEVKFSPIKRSYYYFGEKRIANNVVAANGNHLFVNSLIDDTAATAENNIIDVYSLEPFQYLYSFTISYKYGTEIVDFGGDQSRFFVLTDKGFLFLNGISHEK